MPQLTADTHAASIPPPAIDPATHARLASANNGNCWLCGLRGKHASRVIDTPDLPLLHEFQRRQITNLTDLTSLDNLVFLCSACHDAFSEPSPVWVFLPASLDALIAAEESFHAHRRTGQHLTRPPPAATLPVLYSRYQIRRGYLFTHVFTDAPAQMWAGAPIAAVIRCARVMAGFESVLVEDGGLPIDVALKLQRLLLLYGAPEPRVAKQQVDVGEGTRSGQAETQIVLQVRRVIQRPVQATPHLPVPPLDTAHPDLAAVGCAFSSALNYVQQHAGQQDLSSEAQAWMTKETLLVMAELKAELSKVRKHIDDPHLLPAYATNRDATLTIISSAIPHVLEPYSAQFEDCLVNLFKACGLTARCQLRRSSNLYFLSEISFSSGVAQSAGEGCLGDVEVLNKIEDAVRALWVQPEEWSQC